MTAQPARIDLADLGPGVAWAFEFDENGRGRLLEGDCSFDLTHGRRFVRDESAALLRLRRNISRQERLVQAAHSVLTQLEQNRAESVLQAYRDLGARVRQRVDAFHADLHLQAECARMLQKELAAQLATATNRNLFALTVVTTVLLPPAFVTGYFGMNTKGLPFSDLDYGTVYATILCVLAAGVVYLLIRRYRAVS